MSQAIEAVPSYSTGRHRRWKLCIILWGVMLTRVCCFTSHTYEIARLELPACLLQRLKMFISHGSPPQIVNPFLPSCWPFSVYCGLRFHFCCRVCCAFLSSGSCYRSLSLRSRCKLLRAPTNNRSASFFCVTQIVVHSCPFHLSTIVCEL